MSNTTCEEGIIIIIINNDYFLFLYTEEENFQSSSVPLRQVSHIHIFKTNSFLLPSTSSLQHQTGSHLLYITSIVKDIIIHCVRLSKSLQISFLLNQIHPASQHFNQLYSCQVSQHFAILSILSNPALFTILLFILFHQSPF